MQIFSIEFYVRDYECDLQGVVNNAVYMNYLEHARHEFIKTLNIDFADLHRRGIDPMVVRAEIDYKSSVTSGNQVKITVSMQPQGKMRLVFDQQIINLDSGQIAATARITAAVIKNGRPVPVDILLAPFARA